MGRDLAAERAALVAGATALSVGLHDHQVDQLMLYAGMLEERNKVMNLTRVPPEETVSRHFLDSLTVAGYMPMRKGARALDIGTGAGLPGLVLAIAAPWLSLTLLDGTGKKVAFVSEVATTLGLTNVEALHGRAEEMARDRRYASHYDVGVARAVSALANLAAWGGPLVRPGGRLVAMKSADIGNELRDARASAEGSRLALESVDEVTVPISGELRRVVVWRRCTTAERDAITAARERYGAVNR